MKYEVQYKYLEPLSAIVSAQTAREAAEKFIRFNGGDYHNFGRCLIVRCLDDIAAEQTMWALIHDTDGINGTVRPIDKQGNVMAASPQ